ncbi:hypothetical protein [Actinoplanes sp. N902-109]|uniref:hypothetical protein n=1 Tax=Actinoplanes sp. (strain N902-109) TaxID=649831 RepID=UPI0005A05B9F|nr:hypothetical protein [Actinoplanes sp. N902-109]
MSEWAEPDSVLATYVSLMDQLIERADPGVPLSLTVGGLQVDGELIPQWQWFAEVSELNNYEDAFYTGMAEFVKEQSDLAHQAVKVRDAGLEVTHKQHLALSEPTRYIHLRNARINGVADTGLWRGRLKDISGWTPGSAKNS